MTQPLRQADHILVKRRKSEWAITPPCAQRCDRGAGAAGQGTQPRQAGQLRPLGTMTHSQCRSAQVLPVWLQGKLNEPG